ncbi:MULTISPECIES: PFL_4669 family integrating conjugative element protein [unclassified Gilliamella]|uniref:PFL_4669 family integrating conjugative element protein n=1 Tax=unclassified Gilliamella TaxID=2685620 RepID=UPI002269CA60|nr:MULTISPECIES: TIGR03761 family integrating conjugative element protein [unclassified Gilliamella]MCX8588536.1 TIGR03761 family integrating conjugative element protein [Gilliamella sp. B3801]MCX8592974.1 TIGR03761 family integrating conjugative element protein [Gilliamella sp. B3804]
MTDNKVGVLQSQVALQVHTSQSVRLWHGRKPDYEKNLPGIFGLQNFLFITNLINKGSKRGDPYSDWYMLRVEEKLEQTKTVLNELNSQIDEIISTLPKALIFTETISAEPAQFSFSARSHMGYQAVYILAQYDEIARKIVQAVQFGLIDLITRNHLFEIGDHALRSLFTLVQRYRYSGITRIDLIQNNAAAIAAIAKFGEVPPDIISGQWRSRFSPPLRDNDELISHGELDNEDDDEFIINVSSKDEVQETS